MSLKIAVGSTSLIKVGAVEAACRTMGLDADIFSVDAASGVNAQPVGCEEMRKGARNRAEAALAAHPNAALAVGIENGLINCGRIWFDEAAIVLLFPDGYVLEAKSKPVQFPGWAVEKAIVRGLDKCTVGLILAEVYGWNPSDPHSEITFGQASRSSLIASALVPLLGRVSRGYCG